MTKVRKPRKPRAKALQAAPEPAIIKAETCSGRPPDLRGHLYKIDGMVAALARQVDDLYQASPSVMDLSIEDKAYMAVSECAWPAVVLIEHLQEMLKAAGEMADKLEA